MIGGCSGFAQDFPPFIVAHGNHASPFGINIKGLKSRGFDRNALHAIRDAYKVIYLSGKTIYEAKLKLEVLADNHQVFNVF